MPFLLILPIAYLSALLVMQAAATPYWLWMNIDPSYFYLMNGLEVALGQTPADFHHPGTTTQLIAGLVLRLAHPLLSASHLTDAVLSDPEPALLLVAYVDDILIALAMLWAGFEARKLFGGLTVPALFIQATPFLSTVMLVNGYTVKPEATLIMTGSVLTALLCRLIAEPSSSKTIAALGAATGFAFVTKLHALSLFIVPIFILRGNKTRMVYGVSAVVAILVFAAPILGRLDDMHRWFVGMATHNGPYGEGEAGIIPDLYFVHAVTQLRRPIFSVPLTLGLIVLWKRRNTLSDAERPMARLLAGILVGQTLQVLMVAKQPVSYYLIPAFLTMGMAAALVMTLGRPLVAIGDRTWRKALTAIAALLVITQTLSIVQAVQNRLREKKTTLAMDMSAFGACTKLNFDFASDINFARMLGNWMADWRFKPWLAAHQPADTLMWVPSNGLPQQWDATPIAWNDVVSRASCTVMRGAWGPRAIETVKQSLPDAAVNACSNGDEWVLSIGIPCESAFPGIDSKRLY